MIELSYSKKFWATGGGRVFNCTSLSQIVQLSTDCLKQVHRQLDSLNRRECNKVYWPTKLSLVILQICAIYNKVMRHQPSFQVRHVTGRETTTKNTRSPPEIKAIADSISNNTFMKSMPKTCTLYSIHDYM